MSVIIPFTENWKTITNEPLLEFPTRFTNNLIPTIDNTYDLGSATNRWQDLYVANYGHIGDLIVNRTSTFNGNLQIYGNNLNCTTSSNMAGAINLSFTYPLENMQTTAGSSVLSNAVGLLYDDATLTVNAAHALEVVASGVAADLTWNDPLSYTAGEINLLYDDATLTVNESNALQVLAEGVAGDLTWELPLNQDGSTISINYDNTTIQLDSSNNLHVVAGEVMNNLTYTFPIQYAFDLETNVGTLSCPYDNETITLTDPDNQLQVNLDQETLKYSTITQKVELNSDKFGIVYDDVYGWTVADGDGVVMPMGGMKKYKYQEILDLGFGIDLSSLISLIETAQTALGETILPTGKTGDQVASFLTHASWMAPKYDGTSVQLTGSTSFYKILFGKLTVPCVLKANHAQYRIPFYGTTTLESSSYLQFDNTQTLITQDLKISSGTTVGCVWYNGTDHLTINTSFKYDVDNNILNTPKLALSNINTTSDGNLLFVNTASPHELKTTATPTDFSWDETNKVLKLKNLQLTNTSFTDQEVLFVDHTATPADSISSDTNFKWDKTNHLLSVKDLNITSNNLDGAIFYQDTANPVNKLKPAVHTGELDLSWDATDRLLKANLLSITADTGAGAIWFNGNTTPPRLQNDNTHLFWDIEHTTLEVDSLSIMQGKTTPGLIYFNNSDASNYKLITDSTFLYDNSTNTLKMQKILSSGGIEISSGGIKVDVGGASITGASKVTGNFNVTGLLTAEGDANVAGLLTAEGDANVAGLLTAEGDANVAGLLTCEGGVVIGGVLNLDGVDVGAALIALGIGVGLSIVTSAGSTFVASATAGTLAAAIKTISDAVAPYGVFERDGTMWVSGKANFTGGNDIIYTSTTSGIIKDYSTGTQLTSTNDSNPARFACGVEIGVEESTNATTHVRTLGTTGAHLYVDGGIRQGSGTAMSTYSINVFTGQTEIIGLAELAGDVYAHGVTMLFGPGRSSDSQTSTLYVNPAQTDVLTNTETIFTFFTAPQCTTTTGDPDTGVIPEAAYTVYIDGPPAMVGGATSGFAGPLYSLFVGSGTVNFNDDVIVGGSLIASSFSLTGTFPGINVTNGGTVNIGFSGTSNHLNVRGPIQGYAGLTISAGSTSLQAMSATTGSFTSTLGAGNTTITGSLSCTTAATLCSASGTCTIGSGSTAAQFSSAGVLTIANTTDASLLNTNGSITTSGGIYAAKNIRSATGIYCDTLEATTSVILFSNTNGYIQGTGASSTSSKNFFTSTTEFASLVTFTAGQTTSGGLTVTSGLSSVQDLTVNGTFTYSGAFSTPTSISTGTLTVTGTTNLGPTVLVNGSQYIGYNNTLEFGRDTTVTTSNSSGYIKAVTETTSTNRAGLVLGTTRGGVEVEYVIAGSGTTTSSGTNFTTQAHNFMVGTAGYPASGSVTRVAITSSALTSYVNTTINGTLTSGTSTALTVSTAGLLNVPNTTDVSGTTAAIQTSGGIYCAKKLSVQSTGVSAAVAATNAIYTAGGIYAAKQITGLLSIAAGTSLTVGTSITQGSGALPTTAFTNFFTNSSEFYDSVYLCTGSGSFSTGSSTPLIVSAAGVTSVQNTTQSSSTTSGAAVVYGGMGISKNLYCGGIGQFVGAVQNIPFASITSTTGITLSVYASGSGYIGPGAVILRSGQNPTQTDTLDTATALNGQYPGSFYFIYFNNHSTNSITVNVGTGTNFYIDGISGITTSKVIAAKSFAFFHVVSGSSLMFIKN